MGQGHNLKCGKLQLGIRVKLLHTRDGQILKQGQQAAKAAETICKEKEFIHFEGNFNAC